VNEESLQSSNLNLEENRAQQLAVSGRDGDRYCSYFLSYYGNLDASYYNQVKLRSWDAENSVQDSNLTFGPKILLPSGKFAILTFYGTNLKILSFSVNDCHDEHGQAISISPNQYEVYHIVQVPDNVQHYSVDVTDVHAHSRMLATNSVTLSIMNSLYTVPHYSKVVISVSMAWSITNYDPNKMVIEWSCTSDPEINLEPFYSSQAPLTLIIPGCTLAPGKTYQFSVTATYPMTTPSQLDITLNVIDEEFRLLS